MKGLLLSALIAAPTYSLIEARVGGTMAPDGKTEIHCDLPGFLHKRNISSRGQGCCVFRSGHHSALYQNVPALVDFPEWLVAKGLPGGGYPANVKERIERICKERGVPVPPYIQVTGMDLEVLKLACQTNRMPGVTYSFSPTGRYGGGRIAHMVNLVHADDQWFCVMDNNFIGVTAYEWMTPDEFRRVYAPGWAVILLDPGPPPPPRN